MNALHYLKTKRNWFKLAIFLLIVLIVIGALAIDSRTRTIIQEKGIIQHVKLTDRDGVNLYDNPDSTWGYYKYVEIKEISKYFIDAVISMEDKSFYSNIGVDVPRTTKCVLGRVFGGEMCGGSTITQQYVKLLLENEMLANSEESSRLQIDGRTRTYGEKIEEALVAININRYKTKDEILEGYINNMYFSNLRYGIQSASKGYFNKDAKDLDLAQSAFLAAIPNLPGLYDPYTHFDNTKWRQELILKAMLDQGRISKEQYEFAISEELTLGNGVSPIVAPHFVEMIDSEKLAAAAQNKGEIKTTMSVQLHNSIREIVKNRLNELKAKAVTNAAVVVLDAKSGEVLSLLGSADYWANTSGSKVNSATAKRQPGSTLKPFTYALGIEKGLTADSLISDSKRIFNSAGENYEPKNFDKKYHGDVTVREALANSLNIPAVAVQEFVSTESFYRLFDALELPTIREQNPELAATLGGLSMSLLDVTNAYRVFPNGGEYIGKPKFELTDDSDTPVEKVELRSRKVFGEKSDKVAYVISDILADSDARRLLFGSKSNLDLPFEAPVKTGTSYDYRDSLTIGYTSKFVVGVWIGNSDNSPMDEVSGAEGAAKIWHDVMIETEKYYRQNICKNNCDFSIENPLQKVDTDSYTPAVSRVSGPI